MVACTWDSANKSSNITLSNGDLTAFSSSGSYSGTRATTGRATGSGGKYYWEVQIDSGAASDSDFAFGICDSSLATSTYPGVSGSNSVSFYYNGIGGSNAKYIYQPGNWTRTSADSGYADSSTGVVRFAVDMSAGKMWVGFGASWDNSGDPAGGTGHQFSGLTGTLYPCLVFAKRGTNLQATLNTGAQSWQAGGGPPSGFSAWDSTAAANAATMALTEPQDTFAATGSQSVGGSLSATGAQDTFAVNGTAVATDIATMAVTDAQDVAAILGTSFGTITGTMAATETSDTFAITGTQFVPASGSFALTETSDSLTISGGSTSTTRLFVACGNTAANGFVATSEDGITWTSRHTFDATVISGIYQTGANGGWVAVGKNASANGKLYTSDDLDTWTERTLPAGIKSLNCVHYHDGLWVAASNTSQIITSPDGITWTLRFTGTQPIYQVYYGNRWAASSNGRMYWSDNGTTWNTTTLAGAATLKGLGWSGSLWVMVGGNGKIYTSSDGATWTLQATTAGQNLNDVSYGEGTWVAAGGSGVATALTLRSTNATTWTSTTLGSSAGLMQGVVHNDNTDKWVAVGLKSTSVPPPIYTSSNASSWSAQSYGANGYLNRVVLGTYVTNLTTFGDLAATGSPDTFAMAGTLPTAVHGTFTLTEQADVFAITGFSNVTAVATMALTESADVAAIVGTKVLPNNPGSFALTEAEDVFASTATSVTTKNIVWIVAVDQPDVVLIGGSSPIHGTFAVTEAQDDVSFGQSGAGLSLKVTQDTADQFTTLDAALFDGGILRIYSGNQPTDPEDAPSGTLLAEIPLSDPAFTAVVDGAAQQAQSWSGAATASGVAGWFRLFDATESYWVDGSAGTENSDLIMGTTSLVNADPLTVTAATFQLVFLNQEA